MKRTSLLVLLIFLGVFACALPEIPRVDQTANGTAVAQTVVAIIQQTQDAAQGVVDVSSDTPAATSTVTETPTATSTLTPTLTPTSTLSPTPTLTWTPLLPMVSVSVPTNCRLGPGKIYDMVGALLVGQFVQVYARDPGSNYWYIRNPDNPSEFCWIWGEYATVTGLNSALPVYTPPPSPTPTRTPTPSPSFELSYYDLDSCSGQWWADILLTNTGTVTFRSISMTLRDTDTSTVVTGIEDGFVDRTTCTSTSKKNLTPDRTLHVTTPEFNYDPDGHKLKLSLTVCSDTGLNGTCLTDNITFTP